MNSLSGIGFQFVSLVFDILLLLLLVRLLLQLLRADFYNPLSQAVVRATAFLDPLRRHMGAWNGLDFATLAALLLVKVVQIVVLLKLALGVFGSFVGAGLIAAAAAISLLQLLANFFFWAIVGAIILSWVTPDGRNPAAQVLWSLTEPVLAPARRLLPPLGGLDFSPILVLFGLQVITGYVVPQLAHMTGVLRLLP